MSSNQDETNIDETNQSRDESAANNLAKAFRSFGRFFKDFLDLRRGVDAHETIQEIKNTQSISGANAWMLMCSIMIASLGLSMDSQAVIIGAMLISPLMSPMLGIGLSIGINDLVTLRKSIGHFAIAMFIAIATSTIYFYLSPVDNVTAEIQARTEPTFLDIFVAIFGGTAGIVSIARKDISTTLPGVAIATALMPPLCVTGFGIANGAWASIALPSFYLFFLNSFFVILATYLIIRYLKFPYKKYLDNKIFRKNVVYSVLFSLALIVPSFFIFRGVLRELKIQVSLEQFEETCLGDDRIFLDSYQLHSEDKVLFLKVYGNVINEDKKSDYLECLATYGLEEIDIQIITTSDVNLNRVEIIEAGIEKINQQLTAVETRRVETENFIRDFQDQLVDTTQFLKLQEEIKILFPEILNIGVAKTHFSDFTSSNLAQPTLLIHWQEIPDSDKGEKLQPLLDFVAKRIGVDTLQYIEY